MSKLKENLKVLLLNANISENELARRTGVAQQVINRLLSGENKNPKLATLSPLANYFLISISQLVGDDLGLSEIKLNTAHLGWQKVPLIDWSELGRTPLADLILQCTDELLIDMQATRSLFAVKMNDHSMEPKFSKETLLILDAHKKPAHGDFSLLVSNNHVAMLRQIMIKNNDAYRKALNPTHVDYHPVLLDAAFSSLGLLIQSRTEYLS